MTQLNVTGLNPEAYSSKAGLRRKWINPEIEYRSSI